ncbi:hypothetical protein LTR85_009160 [Meristemomyces frigidus]|nr:hypothetical protein LTR85_009160 [Meristemomyces frigidus]
MIADVDLSNAEFPSKAGILSFVLAAVSLDEQPSYIALSYMCGLDPPTQIISVNGSPYKIRANLHEFMCAVAAKRLVGKPLFIDAVAINQADLTERSSQVRLMRDVYLQASEVIAWLGAWALQTNAQIPSGGVRRWDKALEKLMHNELSAHSGMGMDLMLAWAKSTMSRHDNVSPNLKLKFMEADRMNLIYAYHAAQRPFWTRTWVVQELMLARRLELLIGDGRLQPELVYAMALAYTPRGEAGFSVIKTPAPIESGAPMHRSAAILSGRPTMNAKLRNGQPYRLYQVLIPFGFQHCEEPRDSIFGLLGLVTSQLTPDYRLSLSQLYLHVWIEGLIDIAQATKREQAGQPQHDRNTDDYEQLLQSFHMACMGAFRCSGLHTTIQLITRATLKQHSLPGARHLITTFTLCASRERPWSPVLLIIASIVQYPRAICLELFGLASTGASLRYHQMLDSWSYSLQGLCLSLMRLLDCEMMMPDGEVRRYSEWIAEVHRVSRLVEAGIAPAPLECETTGQPSGRRTKRGQFRTLKLFLQRYCLYVVDYGLTLLLALALAWMGVREGARWSTNSSLN